jgi:hypothetical protein
MSLGGGVTTPRKQNALYGAAAWDFMPATTKTVDEIVGVCRRAAEANRSTSALQGSVVLLSPENADDVMVAADLHGNRRNYEILLEAADLDNHPRRHLIMQEVCHGGPTYPSGTGCMSHLLLEDMARLKTRYPDRFHFILSNHELSELIDYPIVKGGRMLNLMFRCGVQELYGAMADKVRGSYMHFLKSLPLAVRMTNGLLIAHSIPEATDQCAFDASVLDRCPGPADFAEGGAAFRLVWGRDYRAENARAFAKLVDARLLITGHEPCGEGFEVPNPWQIIIDSQGNNGCYVILRTDEQLTQPQVIDRIQRLS